MVSASFNKSFVAALIYSLSFRESLSLIKIDVSALKARAFMISNGPRIALVVTINSRHQELVSPVVVCVFISLLFERIEFCGNFIVG